MRLSIFFGIIFSLSFSVTLVNAKTAEAAKAIFKSKLKFIGDVNFPTGEKFKDTELGGLSGLFFDTKNNRILAVSDDRSSKNAARFYEFNIKLDAKSISLTPFEVVTLKDENGSPFAKNSIDFEGIALVNDEIIISSEGSLRESPKVLPEFLRFSRDGKLKERLKIPAHFLPNPKNSGAAYGSRDNLIFEALSASADGKVVYMGMEGALQQDGEISTLTDPSWTRIIKYKDLKPAAEYVYQIERIPTNGLLQESVESDNGLVDIAVMDEASFYTLERSYLQKANRNVIKIFKVTHALSADDVSELDSIKDKKLKIPKKELALDLDDIVKQLDPKYAKLDNFEGICFGPTLENGHKTLLVVSDNNFNKMQRTVFIAFEILP